VGEVQEVKKWIDEHKLFLGVLGGLGAWVGVGYLIHHLDKRETIDRMLAELPAGSSVLNVGCANWELFADQLNHFRVTNIDVVQRDVPNFVLADVRNLEMFGDKSFDAVYASHVLEHLPREDVDVAISEMNRVAKDPNKVYIVLPRPYFIDVWLNPDHKWIPMGDARVLNHPVATWAVLGLGLTVAYKFTSKATRG